MTEQEIIKEGIETWDSFLQQLDGPNDIYKVILVEELFKFIYKEYYGVQIEKPTFGGL